MGSYGGRGHHRPYIKTFSGSVFRLQLRFSVDEVASRKAL